jgi:hypothetical protein
MLKILTDFKTESDFNFLQDKYKDKPITIFNDRLPRSHDELNYNPYNFLIIHEPNEFFGIHKWVIQNYSLFSVILTWNEDIINNCPNALLFDHGARSEDDEWLNTFQTTSTKKFEISFLSGAKKLVEGHKFRQKIYELKDQIKIPKKWYYVLDDFNWDNYNKGGIGRSVSGTGATFNNIPKRICYNESMFHIAVENVKHNNWYTEKIGDAFASKTVPIYWGCPNIGNHFDERGIIRFETKNELVEIVNSLTPEMYKSMEPYIETNYQLVKDSFFPYTLDKILNQIIELNNI